MFIDIHAHAYRRPEPMLDDEAWFSKPEQVIARYDQIGIEKGVLLPLVSPEVYIPQSNEDVAEFAERFPGRFIPFCNIDPRAMSNSRDAPLGDLLRYYRDRGFRGIGEVMPNLPFLDPLVQNLFRHVEDVGFPLIFDISDRIGGTYGLYDDPGLGQLERCLQRFARLQILGHGPAFWSEIAQLEDVSQRAGYPSHPVREEGRVPELLRKYDNLWGDLSAGSGYNALARDPEYAVSFLNEFQDRLLFGTDICAPDSKLPLAAFLQNLKNNGKLSPTAFEKIARTNAIRVIGLKNS